MHRDVHEAMREARRVIKALAPAFASSHLSLDLRAALLNLDGALSRALAHDGNMAAGADHLEVYSRLSAVHETASTEGPESLATVKPLLSLLDRRQDLHARRAHPPRPGTKR